MSSETQSGSLSVQRSPIARLAGRLLIAAFLVGAVVLLLNWWGIWPAKSTDSPRSASLPKLSTEAEALRNLAFAAAERLVEKYPHDPEALYSKASTHNRFGDSEVAVACWHECLKYDPKFALAYYCLGWNALDHREYDQSIKFLRKAVEQDPAIGHAYLLLAEALMESGRTKDAELPLQAHLRLVPRSVEGHCRLGQVYLKAKDFERAKRYFLAAREINPASAQATDGLATALDKLGETQQAEGLRKHLSNEKNGRVEPEAQRAAALWDLKEVQSAAAFGLTDVGKVCGGRGDLTDAVELWRKAAEIDPQDVECRTLLVSVYQRASKYEEALDFLQELSAIEPTNAIHQINIGVLASRIGQFDTAEKAFRRTQELLPERYEGYAGLAELYFDSGKNLTAATDLARKAVELAPIAGNYYILGMSLFTNGDLKEALDALQQAAELERGNPIYRQALEKVQAELKSKE